MSHTVRSRLRITQLGQQGTLKKALRVVQMGRERKTIRGARNLLPPAPPPYPEDCKVAGREGASAHTALILHAEFFDDKH